MTAESAAPGPCPFLSCEAEYGHVVSVWERRELCSDDSWFHVECACGAQGPERGDYTYAVGCWNTRPIEARLRERVEELEAEVKKLHADGRRGVIYED